MPLLEVLSALFLGESSDFLKDEVCLGADAVLEEGLRAAPLFVFDSLAIIVSDLFRAQK